ncbi:MAG: rod shape-determining protein MreC [Actinobacteria bacterium]|nr:rod shape-determining protein MreC [Actinomycetota bacterium]
MYRRSGRGRFTLIVFLILSIALITFDYRQNWGVLERAKDAGVSIVAPVQRGLTAVFRPVGDFFATVGELGDQRRQNQQLRDEVESLVAEREEKEQLADENERLRDILELAKSWHSVDSVTAEVIGRVPSNYKWAIFINKGTDDGIEKDMPVLAPEGLVGKVVRAEAHRATVLLLVDPQGAAAARVKTVRDTGLITGNGGSKNLSLELVAADKEAKIEVGDEVITSGYDEGLFPAGIPIGEVVRVSGDSAGLEQVIEVRPFVQPQALGEYVQVLLHVGPLRVAKDGAQADRTVAGGG